MCLNNAPELFILDDDGYNRMPSVTVEPQQESLAKRAAHLCPERAIRTQDGGRIAGSIQLEKKTLLEHRGSNYDEPGD